MSLKRKHGDEKRAGDLFIFGSQLRRAVPRKITKYNGSIPRVIYLEEMTRRANIARLLVPQSCSDPLLKIAVNKRARSRISIPEMSLS